jgi:hypothetical protein
MVPDEYSGQSSPLGSSLNALVVLLGIWFIVTGIFEIIGGFLLRHALCASQMTPAQPDRNAAIL